MISEELCLELQLANVFNFEKELKEQDMIVSGLLSNDVQLQFKKELDSIDSKSDEYKKENAPYITSDKHRTNRIIQELYVMCRDRYEIIYKSIEGLCMNHKDKLVYLNKIYYIQCAYYDRAKVIKQFCNDALLNIVLDMHNLQQSSIPVRAYEKITYMTTLNPVSYDKKNN